MLRLQYTTICYNTICYNYNMLQYLNIAHTDETNQNWLLHIKTIVWVKWPYEEYEWRRLNEVVWMQRDDCVCVRRWPWCERVRCECECENLKQIQTNQFSKSSNIIIQTGCFVSKKLWQVLEKIQISFKTIQYPLKGFNNCPIIISDEYL